MIARSLSAIRSFDGAGPALWLAASAVLASGCAGQPTAPTTLSPGPLPTARALPTRVQPTPSPTPEFHLILDPADHLLGPAEAPVSILAYLDFACRYCAGVAQALRSVQAAHAAEVALVYRPIPLTTLHPNALAAAELAEAADHQGAFWETFDSLFAAQDEWLDLSPEQFRTWAETEAAGWALDGGMLFQDMGDPLLVKSIESARDRAQQFGVPGAPVLYLNGRLFQLPPSQTNLEGAVRLELLSRRQFASEPALQIDPAQAYTAVLRFGSDEVRVQLFADRSPQAVNNFLFLARRGWYDGSPVQRVIPGVLFETGDPSGTGLGGPGYTFATELHPDLTFDRAGRVAMTSVGPGTNGSQFFVTLSAQPALDGTRTIFGQVLGDLGFAEGWAARDPWLDLLAPAPAMLEEVRIEVP